MSDLAKLATHLKSSGVFGLWSNDEPAHRFTDLLLQVFAQVSTELVTFPNPLQDRTYTQTIYLARLAKASARAG